MCPAHLEESGLSLRHLAASGFGALIGNAVLPVIGGAIGAFVGLGLSAKVGFRGKKKVFLSFDFDNDRALRDFFIGQAALPKSPFQIIDYSLKEAAPEAHWVSKARSAIASCDIVVVIVGCQTYRACGVLKEIEIARSVAKPIVQLKGYKQKTCVPVKGAGRLYAWTWLNLQRLLK
jgi:hypothetical protein